MTARERLVRCARYLPAALLVAVAVIATRALRDLGERGVRAALADAAHLPVPQLLGAAALTALSFAVLALIDQLVLRQVTGDGAPGWRRSVPASLVAHAIGQGFGFALLTGGVARQRFYARAGLPAGDTARVIAGVALAVWPGAFLAVCIALVVAPGTVAMVTGHAAPGTAAVMRAAGIAGVVAVALALAAQGHAARRWPRVAALAGGAAPARGQATRVVAAAADWAIAATVLWVLLPGGVPLGGFVAIFVVAQGVALASHAPGGIGVFELLMVAVLGRAYPAERIVAALVAFRATYYALPAALALVALAASEFRAQRARWDRLVARVTPAVPAALATLTFTIGAVLLASGATPPIPERMALLHRLLPHPLIASAYAVGSLLGAALLLVARGIQRRLAGARAVAMALLGGAVVVSLLKGLDYEEASLAALALALLLPARRLFTRQSSLVAERFTRSWLVAIAATLAGVLVLALLGARALDLPGSVPWHFGAPASASRAVLSTAAAAGACTLLGLARLLRLVQPHAPAADDAARARARDVVARAPETSAHLALVGDKALLFSDSGNAFLMYGVAGQSWIAMGDPVGPAHERAALVRRFHRLATSHGGRPVFYHVTPENLPHYVELGLAIRKVGESARVALADFALDGSARKWLRRARRNALDAGCTFEVIDRQRVAPMLPAFRRVSDAWLAHKGAREKGFSLGYFDEQYVAQCPAAVVWHDGRVVAFANIWVGSEAHEISVDLMRYAPDAPDGVIDFLFCELLLWSRAQGYRWFDLGVAPLAGLEAGTTLLWNRLGALLFRHGARRYNFAGLRQYKAKFGPEWTPRYIAAPGGITLARAAADVAAIVAAPTTRRRDVPPRGWRTTARSGARRALPVGG